VVLPTYQRGRVLGTAIGSILNQSLRNLEILVMDDGSTDETAAVVGAVKDRDRVRYFRREHLGIPRIVNEGMALARGEYIALCHDHDVYEPDFLSELAGALDKYPNAAFAHCAAIIIEPEGYRETARFVYDYALVEDGRSFLVDHLLPRIACPVAGLSMMRRSSLQGRQMEEEFGPVADVELWLRLSTIGDVAYVRRPLLKIRDRDPSSEFHNRGLELALLTLSAKRKYLSLVSSPAKRRRIERGWRKDIDQAAFAAMWKALEERRSDAADLAEEALRNDGSRVGAAIGKLLGSTPQVISVSVLRVVRSTIHRLRRFTWVSPPREA
jgi:glycosyltransferase involved in cell wall biosynthesis